jgi:hypothetical protein
MALWFKRLDNSQLTAINIQTEDISTYSIPCKSAIKVNGIVALE